MKRMVIPLIIIIALVGFIVAADLWFITSYASGMTERLDALSQAQPGEQAEQCREIIHFHFDKKFWVRRFIPSARLDEIEMLLHKLDAYVEEGDQNEIGATTAEVRARVNRLFSTFLYHWYHPEGYRIK